MQKIKVLQEKIAELESYFKDREAVQEQRSQASVGWHIDHSLKVLILVTSKVETSNPDEYVWKFNHWRSYCFLLNSIPRGRARAPKVVRPPETITLQDLQEQLEEARTKIETVASLPERANFRHHIFGYLNKKQTLKFLALHTEHHLKIIRDILKNK